MQTFPLNNLAEKFEVDRSTMVRAMRGVSPDEVARGNRPKWKVVTALNRDMDIFTIASILHFRDMSAYGVISEVKDLDGRG